MFSLSYPSYSSLPRKKMKLSFDRQRKEEEKSGENKRKKFRVECCRQWQRQQGRRSKKKGDENILYISHLLSVTNIKRKKFKRIFNSLAAAKRIFRDRESASKFNSILQQVFVQIILEVDDENEHRSKKEKTRSENWVIFCVVQKIHGIQSVQRGDNLHFRVKSALEMMFDVSD